MAQLELRRALVARDETNTELRASEARFRAAVDAVQGVLWTNNPNGEMVGDQPGWSALTGQSIDEYEGYGWAAAVHPDDAPPTLAAWNAAVAERRTFLFEHRVRRRDGAWRRFSIRAIPTFDAAGEIREWVGVHTDVTARRAAEERLRDLNDRLEARVAAALAERRLLADLVEGTDAFVQVADTEFRWLALNRAAADEFERIYGRRPRVGLSMLDLLADLPEHREAIRTVWARALSGEQFTLTGEFGEPGRDRRHYEMKFNVLRDPAGPQIGAYQFVYDVTQRVQEQAALAEAQDALRQSQKMEAMGQLTGEVAHDFNNLLTPIVGALDVLQRQQLGGAREQRLVDGAVQSADRAKLLVRRLLAVARRQPLEAVPIDVADLVHGMADLIVSTTGPQIVVTVDAPVGLPPAKTDRNQLEMALLNLVVNARDAMPDGGALGIGVSAQILAVATPVLGAGGYIRVTMTDTGTGMDEATLARAVEPFFSTKGAGEGTGLGLAMVHGLASQLGGALTIRSKPGHGTTMDLWLPQTQDAAETAALRFEPAPTLECGTALLVDDEPLVRLSTADMLTDLGYRVIEAGSAEEALDVIGTGGSIDLVITDQLMPGKTGEELATAIQAIAPGLPVLIVSGRAQRDEPASAVPRLVKPFRRDELAACLARLRPRPAPATGAALSPSP